MTTYSLPLSKKKRAVKTRPPRDALFIAAACALGLIVLVAVAAAVIPFAGDPAKIVGTRLSPPSAAYPLGTDALGRSVLARLLEGTRTTLVLSTLAVVCTAVISVILGLVAGYAGGWAREVIMRLSDVLYSFPSIVLAILIAAVVGPGQAAVLSSIVLVTVPLMTRMVSAAAMSVEPGTGTAILARAAMSKACNIPIHGTKSYSRNGTGPKNSPPSPIS